MTTFTENNILKLLGLTDITTNELKDLIEPAHLNFLCEMYGLKNGELFDENLCEKIEAEQKKAKESASKEGRAAESGSLVSS